MAEVMYGPIQLVLIGFENPEFHGKVRRELESVMKSGVIRLIDLRLVYKDADGKVSGIEATQLNEAERMRFGAAVGGLIGLGAGGKEGARIGMEKGAEAAAGRIFGMTEEDVRRITNEIPNNSAAAFFLIEHLWAKNLKQALRDSGGFLIAQGMLTPKALVAIGAELRMAVEAAEEQKGAPAAAEAR